MWFVHKENIMILELSFLFSLVEYLILFDSIFWIVYLTIVDASHNRNFNELSQWARMSYKDISIDKKDTNKIRTFYVRSMLII